MIISRNLTAVRQLLKHIIHDKKGLCCVQYLNKNEVDANIYDPFGIADGVRIDIHGTYGVNIVRTGALYNTFRNMLRRKHAHYKI